MRYYYILITLLLFQLVSSIIYYKLLFPSLIQRCFLASFGCIGLALRTDCHFWPISNPMRCPYTASLSTSFRWNNPFACHYVEWISPQTRIDAKFRIELDPISLWKTGSKSLAKVPQSIACDRCTLNSIESSDFNVRILAHPIQPI